MSYAAPYEIPENGLQTQGAEMVFRGRARNQWIPFALPPLICGVSWLMGGVARINDFGFLILTCLCLFFLAGEFWNFSRRFGIGGILLYGGVLIWFCHDYMTNWFMQDVNTIVSPVRPDTLAKAAFLYTLFICFMALGLNLNGGKRVERLLLSIPEAPNETIYFIILMAGLAIGICPFFIWVSEPWYMAIFHGAFSSWTQQVAFTVGRTGNLNYDWGAYVAQILQVGSVAGIFASVYAILISRRWWAKLAAWIIWAYWTLFAWNGGRRGELAYMVMPVIGLLFIKYQAKVAMAFKRHSLRAYLFSGVLAVALLAAVQLEGSFRDVGLGNVDVSQLELVKNQGNSMFSEGLTGYQLVPDVHDFFYNTFPGEGLVLALPHQFWLFVIGPIPRALWHTKPIDPLWEWYNSVVTGHANGDVGTTISKGLVGTWYFNYGFWGVVEGGLLMGWLMRLTERCLQNSGGRPMGILMSLGIWVWLFRIYRDFGYIDLYSFLIGAVVLAVLIRVIGMFIGGAPQAAPLQESAAY